MLLCPDAPHAILVRGKSLNESRETSVVGKAEAVSNSTSFARMRADETSFCSCKRSWKTACSARAIFETRARKRVWYSETLSLANSVSLTNNCLQSASSQFSAVLLKAWNEPIINIMSFSWSGKQRFFQFANQLNYSVSGHCSAILEYFSL